MPPHESAERATALERLPGFQEATKFFFALQSWREVAHIALTAVSTVCFTIAGTTGFKEPSWLGVSSGVYWIIGGVVAAGTLVYGEVKFFKPSYGELVRALDGKNRELEAQTGVFEAAQADTQRQLQEALDGHRGDLQMVLDSLVTQLLEYVCKGATDCRISAYSVEGSEFLLLSRCSRNPQIEQRGRDSYPLTEGNIGQAWAKEWALQDHESTDRGEWEEALVDANLFSEETASALTMQSRSIYAQRIDRGAEKIGMVVLECENPGRFNRNTLKLVQASLLMKAIAEILWSSHTQFPRVAERQEELTKSEKRTVVVPEPEWKRAKPISRSAVVESSVPLTELHKSEPVGIQTSTTPEDTTDPAEGGGDSPADLA